MGDFYADSSVLVKRHVAEVGSAWFRALADPTTGNTIVTAQVSMVEVTSAFRTTGFLIDAAPSERALAVLRPYPELNAQPGEDGTIEVAADAAAVPALVRALVSADVDIFGVRARRNTLEKLFLDLTGQPAQRSIAPQTEVVA